MIKKIAPIIGTDYLTHDVKHFTLMKPPGYSFEPGQATEVAINRPGWEDRTRPFTFTGLPGDDYLELAIKIYPEHEGVTRELNHAGPGDELILHEVFGAIRFRGDGVFIAGGAGITPFISILRMLEKEGKNKNTRLLFGNKTRKDIILKEEFRKMLGDRFVNVLSEEKADGYLQGYIDRGLLKEYTGERNRKFYICGPPPMVEKVSEDLRDLGVAGSNIITEDL